jgi:HAD superfamily hydrolase (TIGR01490 family)
MKELVIFDVDGTIIKGQSQKLFLSFMFKEKYIPIFGFIKLNFWFIFYKLGLIKNPLQAMNYAYSFLEGRSTHDVENLVEKFFDSKLKGHIYEDAAHIIRNHLNQNREVILLSNSADILIRRIARYLNVYNFISTKLEIQNDIYTGKISGEIIYGQNKIKAVESYLYSKRLSWQNSWSYADHYSDIPLLSKTSHIFAVNPSSKLKRIATEKRWQVLQFKT